MKFLQNAVNKHLVNNIIDLGHQPAPKPENEDRRLKDLKDLKILRKILTRANVSLAFPS